MIRARRAGQTRKALDQKETLLDDRGSRFCISTRGTFLAVIDGSKTTELMIL
jgi:hypothetical protein